MEDLSANLKAPSWWAGELPTFLLTFFRILCGPVTYDFLGHPAFSGATSCSNNTAVSLVLLKPSDGQIPSSPPWRTGAHCV